MSRDLTEAVKYVIDNNGKNVLLDYNRFIKAFYKSIDAPDMIKDRHPVDIAMEKGIGELFMNSRPEDIKQVRAEMKSRLNGILSEKVIDMITDAFVSALGWNKELELIKEIEKLSEVLKEIKEHSAPSAERSTPAPSTNKNESSIPSANKSKPTSPPEDFEIVNGVLIKYKGSDKVVYIPDSVTSIGDWAFGFCVSLKGVTIPYSVTSIGEKAFLHCGSLKNLTIPNSVKSIGKEAFRGCESLKSVTIPDSVTSIGESAFSKCTSLTSVIIPNSVASIGDFAFYGCTSLTSVTISDSVTNIGELAFGGCSNLEISIPKKFKYEQSSFEGCKNVTIREDNRKKFFGLF